jgi:hypothetical protein
MGSKLFILFDHLFWLSTKIRFYKDFLVKELFKAILKANFEKNQKKFIEIHKKESLKRN